jgi:hypothetical protein
MDSEKSSNKSPFVSITLRFLCNTQIEKQGSLSTSELLQVLEEALRIKPWVAESLSCTLNLPVTNLVTGSAVELSSAVC